jgi:hypothetical protein
VSWFSKSAAAEVEPPETDETRLAKAKCEAIFAEAAWNEACAALRSFNIQHEQNRFAFTNAFDTTYIVTMANSAERKRLERDVRQAKHRRDQALNTRANLLLRLGLIF